MKNAETISDSKDCEKIKVTLALMTELEKGEDSAREEGWISADEVEKTLRDMGYSKENRIDIDYMKISHHASKGNISDGMLDLIKCNKYIISTNGTNRDKFPHKETFARILRHPLRSIDDKIQFIFNYDTNELKNIFYDEEYELYNFECIYPKGGENNVTIPIYHLSGIVKNLAHLNPFIYKISGNTTGNIASWFQNIPTGNNKVRL